MKILHLYHDFLNLYGDYANVSAMERILKNSGEAVEVDRLSLGGSVDFSEYDFIYIGSGTERNLRVALEDFKKYETALKEYIESEKAALFTGNSFEMLGASLTDCSGNTVEGLKLFDFTCVEQNKTRNTADVIFGCDFLDKPLVGFVNKCSEIKGIRSPLFSVKMGLSNCGGDKYEGVRENNFFGTHLTGPVLIKNPHFLTYLAEIILGKTPESGYLKHERAGFEVTLSELKKRMNAE